jgi:hypothetical protein
MASEGYHPMLYTQDISGCLAESVGDRGLRPAELDAALGRAAPALRTLVQRQKDGSLPLLTLPARRDDLAGLGAVAAEFRRRFEQVLVLGIGGSSLGGQTLARPGGWRLRPAPRRAASLFYGEHRPREFCRAVRRH